MRATSPSNKHQTSAVEAAPSARTDRRTISVSPPILDKLSVCVRIEDPEERKGVNSALLTMQDMPEQGYKRITAPSRYRSKLLIPVRDRAGTRHPVCVFANPADGKSAFLRIEFNPSKLGAVGLRDLKNELETTLPWGYAQVLETAHVTRLDLAVDLYGVDLNDITVRAAYKRANYSFVSLDGRLETQYLGRTKHQHIAVYDKALESRSSSPEPFTRIEARLRPQVRLRDLPTIENPFSRITIFDLHAGRSTAQDYVWQNFRDSCRIRGVKGALRRLPEDVARRYAKRLEACVPEWWKPDRLWTSWDAHLAELDLLVADYPFPAQEPTPPEHGDRHEKTCSLATTELATLVEYFSD